jgi:hypothetical protein
VYDGCAVTGEVVSIDVAVPELRPDVSGEVG